MTRRTAAVLAAGAALAACGGDAAASGRLSPSDSLLADALAEVHLADARAEILTDSARVRIVADSLRAVALATHGLDETAFAHRVEALAERPDEAVHVYEGVERILGRERRGAPSPDPTP